MSSYNDKNVPKKLVKKILNSLPKKKIFLHYFNSSEKNKNQKSINEILSILLSKNFNRNDCVISIGGGITGDVSGFAASIFKRGLKLNSHTHDIISSSRFFYWWKDRNK